MYFGTCSLFFIAILLFIANVFANLNYLLNNNSNSMKLALEVAQQQLDGLLTKHLGCTK